MWNLVKIGEEVSEKKTFKDFMILYLYIAQGQAQILGGGRRRGEGEAKFWS